jgi:acyl-CoA hydrolase
VSVFAGPPVREAIERGDADFIPIFVSDIPSLFLTPQIPLHVALQLSPPDAHGYCTLGTSVDAALAASQMARYVIAEINDRMPRTHGNTLVPMSRIHAFIHTSRPLWVHEAARRPLKNRPSAPTSRRSSRTVPRCKWGLARFRTPCVRGDLRRAFAETRHITV